MKRKTIYAVALVSLALVLVGSVSAFGLGFGVNNPNLSDDEREAMNELQDQIQTAIENNDYATWKSLMESQLTEDNFNSLVEMHDNMEKVKTIREQMRQAREDGDEETFEELQTQLQELMPQPPYGFDKGMGHGRGMGFGHFNNMPDDSDPSE